MRKIRILLVVGSFKIGGTEGHVLEMLKRIDPDKYEIHLCCMAREGELLSQYEDLEIDIIDLNLAVKLYSFYALKRMLWLARFIRNMRIDIVHTYLVQANLYGGSAAKLARARLIVSRRGWETLRSRRNKHYLIADYLLFPFADSVLVNSQAIKRSVIQNSPVSPRKIHIIYNGVDYEKFSPNPKDNTILQELGINSSDPVVGIVATLKPVKNHSMFLHAAAQIANVFPDAKFLIVGDGRSKQELQKLSARLGLDGNVIFTGTRQDVAGLLSIIDVFTLCSQREGFSNAILEAMAMGKPVVATNVGGNKESIIQGKTGLLVHTNDASGLSKAVLSILSDKRLASSMGHAARELVQRRFSMEEMMKRYEELYDDLYQKQ